ncbi:MAG TPA: glycerate kinase [Cellulomonas sp.]
MRVLIAPGRFDVPPDTGPAAVVRAATPDPWPALTAPEAAAAVADGWARTAPDDTLDLLPLSDGGPGLLDVLRSARGGELLAVTTTDACGAVVPGAVLVVAEESGARTAYVDAALALGAADGAAVDPARTTSTGLGTLVAAALGTGAGRVVVGLGARRTVAHDGGAGMLAALGAAPEPARGGPAAAGLLTVEDLAALAGLRAALAGRDLVVLHGHDLPLVGLNGISADLGTSGRVDEAAAQRLEGVLARFAQTAATVAGGPVRADLLRDDLPTSERGRGARSATSRAALAPGSGAGGGAAFALGLLGARLVEGGAWVADAVGLTERVAAADVVVTGVGVLDGAAVDSGVVGAVAAAALPVGVPAVALAARLRIGRRDWGAAGIAAGFAVVERETDEDAWRADPAAALRARVPRIAQTWSR